jgi:hypothetical protein
MFWIIQKYLTEKVEELGNNLPQGKFVALCIYLFYVIQGFHYFFRLVVPNNFGEGSGVHDKALIGGQRGQSPPPPGSSWIVEILRLKF